MLDGRDATARRTGLPTPDHVRNPIGELNEKWVEHFRTQSRAQVLEAFDEVIAARTAGADGDDPGGVRRRRAHPGRPQHLRPIHAHPGVRLLDSRSGPARRDDRWAPTRPATAGRSTRSPSPPFVVGKRAGAPDGTTVVFDITGPAARTIRVAAGVRVVVLTAVTIPPTSRCAWRPADLAPGRGRTSADRERVTVIGRSAPRHG